MIHIHDGISLSLKKRQNTAIYNNTDRLVVFKLGLCGGDFKLAWGEMREEAVLKF